MKENPRFIHLANHRHEQLFSAPIMIGGFYNWHLAMEGDFNLFKMKRGELEDYDILFIGMSKPELEGNVASQIRKEIGWDTDTKLVICIDYGVELWDRAFNPHALETELLQADMLFVAEPAMKSHVEACINERMPVHFIPHPTNIDAIAKFAKPLELRTDEIAALIHRYDNNWLDPYLTTKDLEYNTYAVLLDPNIRPNLHAFFKYMVNAFEFVPYLEWVSNKRIILDSYHRLHTYGRTAVDAACMRLPVVGANWTWAQEYLWPDLTAKAGHINDQKKMIIKLMEDDSFYEDCTEKAYEEVLLFSYEERKKQLLDKLYNG